jgi:hypothetical protein
VHGKLTSQRSLLTKSKGKIKGQPEPHRSPCGSRMSDGTRLESLRPRLSVGTNGKSVDPFGRIGEFVQDGKDRNDEVIEKLGSS